MTETTITSVYGPIKSWRMGNSLGIDLIMDPSTCSFNCTYCQLGFIQNITSERKIYVSTEKVINDFKNSDYKNADVITFSGSGEPTLALNIGEVIKEIKKITEKKIPIVILTNASMLNDDVVLEDIKDADIISCKLDSIDDETLKMVNRPAIGITHKNILSGIKKLKSIFKGKIQLQIMFMPQNKTKVNELAKIINDIKPDEVALNTPTRPYPSGWDIFSRGAHGEDSKKIKYDIKPLKQLTKEEAKEIENKLKELTGVKILSVYKD